MTDDADATAPAPDPDDHVARLQAEIGSRLSRLMSRFRRGGKK